MARLSMNEMTTYRWSFEEDVRKYRAAGYAGIAVWRQKLSDFGEEKGLELLSDCGLQVSSLLWAGGFTGSDGRSFRESIDDAAEAVRLAAEMEAACLVVYSGGRAGHTHNHARRLVRSALTEVVPLAAQLGVTLALEPMHPACAADWTFLTDLDAALDLAASLPTPGAKIVLDTYHVAHEPRVIERLGSLVPHVAIVHLGDARTPPGAEQDRCLLGEGTLPLRELVGALRAAGYDGFFDIELMGEEIEASDYDHILAHSRRAAEALLAATD